MQFDRDAQGTLTPLPKPCVDTGAGLERVATILQGKTWNYDTDVFRGDPRPRPAALRRPLRRGPEKDVSLRVVADHARAVTFLIGDGVLPSNEGRGYVLRRILRRAARHGVLLGVERPFLHQVCDAVIDEMGRAPTRASSSAAPTSRAACAARRSASSRRSRRASRCSQDEIARAKAAGQRTLRRRRRVPALRHLRLPGRPHRGHPLGRGARASTRPASTRRWTTSANARAPPGRAAARRPSGRSTRSSRADFESALRRLRPASAPTRACSPWWSRGAAGAAGARGRRGRGVVEETPFYAESGGQVGDRGAIETPTGRVEVDDMQRPVAGLVVHRGKVVRGEVHVDQPARLVVDSMHRAGAVRHHSGTHLLHAALREVLGDERDAARLAGDARAPALRLQPRRARHARAARHDRRPRERLDRARTRRRWCEEMPHREAIAAGALAMFGEKYGDLVRVRELRRRSRRSSAAAPTRARPATSAC